MLSRCSRQRWSIAFSTMNRSSCRITSGPMRSSLEYAASLASYCLRASASTRSIRPSRSISARGPRSATPKLTG